jgi:hypothetical protein
MHHARDYTIDGRLYSKTVKAEANLETCISFYKYTLRTQGALLLACTTIRIVTR